VTNQSHVHTGSFSFSQEANGFIGGGASGFSGGPKGHYTGPLASGTSYDIVDGVQAGDHVSFRSELCTYEGTMSTDNAHIAGKARCAYTEGESTLCG
jgi:hypothetical protein